MLDGGGWFTPRFGRFTPGKETRYPLYRRVGGSQDRSERLREVAPPPGFDPRTVQFSLLSGPDILLSSLFSKTLIRLRSSFSASDQAAHTHTQNNRQNYIPVAYTLLVTGIQYCLLFCVCVCACAAWSLALKEERSLMSVFENRVLSRIFGPERGEVTGEWRGLHKELCGLHTSPNIVRVMKSCLQEVG